MKDRVAFFIPTLTGGGAERVLVNVLKMLPDHERHLVLLSREVTYDYDATLHVLGGDFGARGAPLGRLRLLGENLARLALLKRRLPATWVSFTTWPNILNVLARGEGRVIVTSHNHESTNIAGKLGPLIRAMVRFTYPRADVVVTVSEAVKRDLIEHFGVPAEKILTIYNTVDLAEAERQAKEPPEAALAPFRAARTIVTAGSQKKQKGQAHLVRAFAAVKRAVPDARLVLLGEGPLGPSLVTLSRELGLATHAAWEGDDATPLETADVAFLGFRRNPFAVYALSKVFAFPSLWEGFGNVLVEAMTCGVPVVSTDCASGPREILAPGGPDTRLITEPEYAPYGVLTPRLDGVERAASAPLSREEQTFADVLTRLLADADLRARYAAAGQRRAQDFALTAIAPAWRRLMSPA